MGRLFSCLPLPVKPDDVIALDGGFAGEYVVGMVKVADDLRDAECPVIERHDQDFR